MELQDFIQKFAEQFEDIDANSLTGDTNFRKLDEWSSLTALAVIAMVDEEYDIRIKGSDIRTAMTIEDLFNIVKSKK